LKRDDAFSTTMLGHAIDHLVNEISVLQDSTNSMEEKPDYDKQEFIEKFLNKKAEEEKNLPNVKITSNKSKGSALNTSVQASDPIVDVSANDCEMEISN